MSRRENDRLLAAIRSARQARQRVALATVVRVRGSAYRREGARIAVREDGSYECLLSGGCLEPEVAAIAAHVIESGRPTIKQYDLEDDSVWSLGLGCSGAVDVYVERLDDDPITNEWLDILDRGDPGVLVKPLSGAAGLLLVREREVAGSLGTAKLDEEAIDHARKRMRAPAPASGPEHIGGAELFFDVSLPPSELVVFGAGPDAEPVARLGWELGLSVTVVDVREAFLTGERFPHATLVPAHFGRFASGVALHGRSFVVIMNHHVERDRESLRFALESEAPYIGVLGPRARYERLLDGLREEGVEPDAARVSRVHSPVGLALGAESPEEIAVSILGEILAVQRGFDGGFLAGRGGSLHRSPITDLARS